MITTLDLAIVSIFVLVVLAGGFVVQYVKKVKTHLTFIVTASQAPWFIVMGLLAAEMIHGGQTVGYMGWVQLFGISALWYLIIIALGFLWQIPLAVKIRKEELKTIPEIIEKYMDAKCAIIVGLVNIFFYITVLGAVCYLSFAAFAEPLFGWPAWFSMLLIAVVCVVYSGTAGLWSIGWLNFIQYLVIIVGVCLAGYFGVTAAGGWGQMTAALPAGFWDMTPGPVGVGFITLMIIFFWFFGYMIWAGTNRSLMSGKTPKATATGAIGATLGYIPFLIGITVCGIAAYVLLWQPGLITNPDMALPVLLRDYVPTGVSGLAMAAVLAAMITTAANCLFASGTTISYDFVHKHIKRDASDRYLIWLARVFMAVLAFAWLAVTLWWRPLVLEGLMFAYAVAAGGIIMPAFFTLLEHAWGRTQKTLLTTGGFFWGVLVGFAVGLGYYLFLRDITWACQYGAFASAVVSLGLSAVQRAQGGGRKTDEPPKSTEWAVKLTAILTVIFLFALVALRTSGMIY
ncbi:MAG: sodium:solute symporter family protein [Candidatus Verstraetearchaeota archaeon]|nr:sodium:solute symporter family protein [Candidatus Verstraetearchaeota archaeon]